MKDVVFVETEISEDGSKILDIRAIASDGKTFDGDSVNGFSDFAAAYRYVCGYHAVIWDAEHLGQFLIQDCVLIDTLPLLPILLPGSAKASGDSPTCEEIQRLFGEELEAFDKLPDELKAVYTTLLWDKDCFAGFFNYVMSMPSFTPVDDIRNLFAGDVCAASDIEPLILNSPVELAYALGIIATEDRQPGAFSEVYKTNPSVESVMNTLRGTPCGNCEYCSGHFNLKEKLKEVSGLDDFKTYDGQPLLEEVVFAAVSGDSLLAVFPAETGKSLAVKIPAAIAEETVFGETVVLTSGMQNDADELEKLAGRNIARFVINGAQKLSPKSAEFDPAYLNIAEFLKKVSALKNGRAIPVSCFAETNDREVVDEILAFFKEELHRELNLFSATETRGNLKYSAVLADSENDRYNVLLELLKEESRRAIVFCNGAKMTEDLTLKLRKDGLAAAPWNLSIPGEQQTVFKDAFASGMVKTLVATKDVCNGFETGDVSLVVLYGLPDSIDIYLRLAGIAGMDGETEASCVILFTENDADRCFAQINRNRVSISDIGQMWRGIVRLSGAGNRLLARAEDLTRAAGWGMGGTKADPRFETALRMLVRGGYIDKKVAEDGSFEITVRADKSMKYKTADYEILRRYYENRIEQTHLVGKLAERLCESQNAGLGFIGDGFTLKHGNYLVKYFGENGAEVTQRCMSDEAYEGLVSRLTEKEKAVINDSASQYIVVQAGAGVDRKRLLVKKITSLLMLEETRPAQLLVLVFSVQKAEELKTLLHESIGPASRLCEITTFGIYRPGETAKTAVLIDDAHLLDNGEFAMLRSMVDKSDKRVIAFADASCDSHYLDLLVSDFCAKKYEL